MKILKIYKETISDGPGWRYSIYVAGCLHACEGCHNMMSWSFKNGVEYTPEYKKEILDDIRSNEILTGVTFSGGDPMFSPFEILDLVKSIKKELNKNIWLYTGFTIEELIERKDESEEWKARYDILKYVDTLVDGRWVKELYDSELSYRGSSNQRLIKPIEWLNK